MDKLFRKRTEKGSSRSISSRKKEGKPRAPKPKTAVPPSLDIDIRNSLIMPSMTERFSMLLPGLSAAPETSVRGLLAQQRTRTDGPSLTEEEEEMLFAELRGNAPSQMSFSQMTNISEWDGNPPPFENDWGSVHGRGSGIAGSVSSPSHMTASGSDGRLSVSSPRSPGDRLVTSPAPSMSPSVMDRGRALPGRSHGFSSNQSFRDNNYLAKVAKDKDDHNQLSPPGSTSRRKGLPSSRTLPGQWSGNSSGSSNEKTTRSPGSVSSAVRSDPWGTASPSSERSVTPTATLASVTPVGSPQLGLPGTFPGAFPASPPASITSTPPASLNRQASDQSYQSYGYSPSEREPSNWSGRGVPVGRRPSNQSIPASLDRQFSSGSGASSGLLDRQASYHSQGPGIGLGIGSPLDRETSNRSATSGHSRKPSSHTQSFPGEPLSSSRSDHRNLERSVSNRSNADGTGGAERVQSPSKEPYTTPLMDEPSRLRTKSTGAAPHPQARQSLLMGLSPAQAKRISMALLEIETRLGNQGDDSSSGQEYVVLNEDQEEILKGDDNGPETESDEDIADQRNAAASQNATSPPAPLFPYPLAPPPEAPTVSLGSSTPANKSASLPASPRTHDLQAMQASQNSPSVPSSARGAPSPSSGSTSNISNGSRLSNKDMDRDSSGTQYSERDYALPALKPFRPQPVRHTPSPGLGNSVSTTGSLPGYVPGQPRPVGSRLSPASLTATSPSSISSNVPQLPNIPGLPNIPSVSGDTQKQQPASLPGSATMAHMPTQNANLSGGTQLARTMSAHASQATSNNGSRSNTPTQPAHRIDHAPPPGVLASRHQGSHSVSDMGTWRSTRSTSSVGGHSVRSTSKHSPTSSKHSPSSSLRSPIARITALDDRHSAATSTPMTPVTTSTHKSRLTLSPSTSARLNHRPSNGSLSSTCSTSLETEDSSPWDAFLRHESSDNMTPLTPNDDQDRADLDLLKTSSGLGKEELAMIQERLVEKAKHERDKLRVRREESEQVADATELSRQVSAPQSDKPRADWPVQTDHNELLTADDSPIITSAPARLDGSESESHYSQFPTHTVPRSELPRGPPPSRPPPPSSAVPPETSKVVSPGPNSAVSAPPDVGANHPDLSPQRKWIDEDPEARRDIEERIALATTNLFRAPSRTAHKRSLSKKNIGSPVLVSSSAKVPTTPITSVENPPTNKGIGPRKLSQRFKKGFFRKHGSGDGVPPPMPQKAATATSPGAVNPSPTAAQRSATPIAAAFSSTSTTPKATQTAQLHSPLAGSPEVASPASDIKGQLNRTKKDARDGRASPIRRGSPVPLRSSPRGPGPTSPVVGKSTAEIETYDLGRTMSKASAKAALDTITDSNPPDEGDHIRQIPPSSDASIQRFYEAGRAVGLDDHRLSEILDSASASTTPRTPSVAEFDTPASPTHISPSAQIRQGRIPSPVAEDIVTFGETADPTVVRRTLVMPNADSAPSSPYRTESRRNGPSPLQVLYHESQASNMSPPTSPTSPMKRGNSIRRKPIQYTGADVDLIERSPKMSNHRRTESNTSAYSLPPRKFSNSQSDVYDSAPPSAASRSSMGLPHSSTNGSFIDYYSHDNNRASQGLEITEYADGRVVWNIVNALRSNDGHARSEYGSVADAESRTSMLSIRSQSSNYTGSRRDSSRMEDHAQPWHVGPTQGLSFIRRPETRVFYTNSMDVADLIDQLSMDHAGATRGRIDIRPTATGQMEFSTMSDLASPTSADFHAPELGRASGEFHGAPRRANAPDFRDAPPLPQHDSKHLYAQYPQHPQHPQHSQHASQASGSEAQSPSSASFLSDTSGERTVEDRLQSLMDRLRAAPGGMSGR